MKLLRAISLMAIFGLLMSVSLLEKASAHVGDDLNANYNKIVNDCGSATRPAFLCSGNIIRFTYPSDQYHVWDLSPNARQIGGVSFTYLRKDIKVTPGYEGATSGIIYYPSMLKPYGKWRAEVTCTFPTDGWTGARPDGGCGETVNYYPGRSKRCQDQGIYTAGDWMFHFNQAPPSDAFKNVFEYSCGFDTRIGVANTANIFNQSLQATRQVYRSSKYYNYNEMVIKTWPTDSNGRITNPDRLPIQAFFYIRRGGSQSRNDAISYQRDYYRQTHICVPVVLMFTDQPNNIFFSYDEWSYNNLACK